VIQTRTNRRRGDYYGTPLVQSTSIGLTYYVTDRCGAISYDGMIVDTGADLVTVFNHKDMCLNEDLFRYAIVDKMQISIKYCHILQILNECITLLGYLS
jgi:hypothetical protein